MTEITGKCVFEKIAKAYGYDEVCILPAMSMYSNRYMLHQLRLSFNNEESFGILHAGKYDCMTIYAEENKYIDCGFSNDDILNEFLAKMLCLSRLDGFQGFGIWNDKLDTYTEFWQPHESFEQMMIKIDLITG